MNGPVPDLIEAVNQLDQWDRVQGSYARLMCLYWAQRSHYLATMALAEAQDKVNGFKEGLPHTEG